MNTAECIGKPHAYGVYWVNGARFVWTHSLKAVVDDSTRQYNKNKQGYRTSRCYEQYGQWWTCQGGHE